MSEALLARFAPTLFLHPQETYVPVDAKRYLERAALWQAGPPALDDKSRWGGQPSSPFPRQPLVTAGRLAGRAGEPGELVDDEPFVAVNAEEMFLELGGWKDAAGTNEPEVTASSGNRYADRGAIAALYADGGPLSDSRFWYHAEFYRGERLTRMAAKAGPPDFSPFLTEDSVLLLYYFFFPVHEQTLCDAQDIDAKENSCHAGDWQCMGILLEGEGNDPDDYTPTFFGTTGSRMLYPDKASVRPQEFDDDGYTVMRVERWRPNSGPARALPQLDGTHPRLFVALGSHSLHTTPGEKDIWPYRPYEGPNGCGTWDTPGVTPKDAGVTDDVTFPEAVGAFFGKVIGGLAAGGPLGGIAGIALSISEGTYPRPMGLNLVGFGSTADPDKVAAAGEGLTIKPRGVTVSGVGTEVEDWRVERNKRIGPRIYDFMVDRDEQRFWPNDDGELGFLGRWGQRVTSDFLPRRSGPKFPNYLKLFLLALAAGDVAGNFDDE